ncbi:hypothetical protein GWI33_008512 [Rhynchophorus ferrugineus]|uniref:Uncharacterized protein n=1 Tax=Rhynchophorus ferrugineus TaxID=354439 RepID=A0A834MHB8_RHYFE|nr:hypothetical protein GWI33_008512 [Rhynchophorus ferrugineus]
MGWLMLLAVVLALLKLLGVTQGTTAQPPAQLPQSTPSPVPGLPGGGIGGIRRTLSGWREWRRADPTLINSLWRSKMGNGIRKQLGNAEVYIILALLIGVVTVVIGCWLSDNCWSPDPETGLVTVA